MNKSAYIYFSCSTALAVCAFVAWWSDAAWSDAIRSWAWLGVKHDPTWELMNAVRAFGKGEVLVCLALFAGAMGLRKMAWRALLALLIVMVVTTSLKVSVGRSRPNAEPGITSHFSRERQSFPSGDSAAAAALFGSLASGSPVWLVPAAAGAAAVALMRMHDGAHYPSDVLAGLAIGFAAAGAALRLRRPWLARLSTRIRTSWFAALFIIVFSAFLVPCLLRNRGVFLDFTYVLGPTLAFLLLARHLPSLARIVLPRRKEPEDINTDLVAQRELRLGLNAGGGALAKTTLFLIPVAFMIIGAVILLIGFGASDGLRLIRLGEGLFYMTAGVDMIVHPWERKGNEIAGLAFLIVFILVLYGVLDSGAKQRHDELMRRDKADNRPIPTCTGKKSLSVRKNIWHDIDEDRRRRPETKSWKA